LVDRRTFLTKLVSGFTLIAALGLSIPFVRSLFPARPVELHKDIDISSLRPGMSMRTSWLGRAVVITARTREQLALLQQIEQDNLLDPDSVSSIQPEFARNSSRSRQPDYFLAFANCTHLGCEILVNEDGGFKCPCHQSQFDAAGRILKGGAAKRNLDVPDYRHAGPDTIRLIYQRT